MKYQSRNGVQACATANRQRQMSLLSYVTSVYQLVQTMSLLSYVTSVYQCKQVFFRDVISMKRHTANGSGLPNGRKGMELATRLMESGMQRYWS